LVRLYRIVNTTSEGRFDEAEIATMKRAIGLCVLLLLMAVASVIGGGAGASLYRLYLESQQQQQKGFKSQSEQLDEMDSFGKSRTPNKHPIIAALGRLKPRGDVIDIAGLMGARLASLKVKEGDRVKEGDVLGFLDNHAEAEAERNAAAAQLAEAKKRLDAEKAYSQALIQQAQIGVREAEKLDPLDIKAQEIKVSLLESALATHRSDLKRLTDVTPGAVSSQQLGQQELLVRRDVEERDAAQAMLEKARAGAVLKAENARAALLAAEAGLKRVESSVQIESLTKNLALAEAHLNRTILKAPSDGTILKILTHPGETAERMPILKMGDTAAMYAVAEVYETDVLDVEVGQTATVKSGALDGELRGTVERIGQMVFKSDVLHVDPAADADARVVEVWILLDSPGSKVAERMTDLQVDVKIKLTVPPATIGAGQSSRPVE
jgi:HlyD family secretion protein